MRRTGPALLLVVAALGVGAGFLLDQLLTASGRMTFTPPLALPLLLVALGAIDVALAIPVRRSARGQSSAPIDPFHAVRIAMLAKASSVVGAAVGGVALGLLLFVLSRPVTPGIASWGPTLLAMVCAAALVAAAVVAEHMCTIRKDDDEDERNGPSAPAAGG